MSSASEFLRLFLLGLRDSINFPSFITHVKKSPLILLYVVCFVVFVCALFLPAASYLDNHVKQNVGTRKNESFILSIFARLPETVLFKIFFFLPWSMILIMVTAIACSQIATISRKGSSYVKYVGKEKKTAQKSNNLIVFGLTLVKTFAGTFGMVFQNVLAASLPLIGPFVGFFVGAIYAAMLSFSCNLALVPAATFTETDSLPVSKEPLEIFAFAGKNWPYFLGFNFIIRSIHFFLIQYPYGRELICQVMSLVAVVMAFSVTESIEVELSNAEATQDSTDDDEKKKASQPKRFTKDGLAPFEVPISLLPRMIARVITTGCDKVVEALGGDKAAEKEL